MSAPTCGVSKDARIGEPPEHREFRHLIDNPRPDIHPTALVEAFATVDSGTERATKVGARTWLMKHVHLGHDAIVGDDCELSPGAVVCGFAEIGNGVRMGVNSCVRPYIKVGDGARIGMGAVVVKDVPAGEVWVGNPAKSINYESDDALWSRLYGR